MSEQEVHRLTAETLAKLDRGAAAAAFDRAITQAVRDCLDRPSDDRVRKVTLELQLTPIVEVLQNVVSCEGAHGSYKVRYKQPDWESAELDFGVRKPGMLIFNENSPANHRQTTLLQGGAEDDA